MADGRREEGHLISPAPARVAPTMLATKAKATSLVPSSASNSPIALRPESPQRGAWGKAIPTDSNKEKRMSVGLYLNSGSPMRNTPPPPPELVPPPYSPPPAAAHVTKSTHLSTPLSPFSGFSAGGAHGSGQASPPGNERTLGYSPPQEIGRPRAERAMSPPRSIVSPPPVSISPRGPVVPRVPPNVPSLPPFTGAYARVMLSPQTRDSAISPATSPRELSTASALSPVPGSLLDDVKESEGQVCGPEEVEQPVMWQHRLYGKRVILSENAAAAPILRMLPPYDNREYLFLLESDEFRRLVDRGRQVSESARIFAKYLAANAPLGLRDIPEEMALACIPTIAQPANASLAFEPIADLVRKRFALSPVQAFKNVAQTLVQGLLLNDDPYRVPELVFPALASELTRSDSITWTTLPESTEAVKLEERVLEGSAVPILRATSIISASSDQPLRLMLASILSTLSIRRQWDETCTDARLYTRLNEQQAEIIHLKYHRLTENLKRRDYVVMQARRVLSDKTFISVMTSIELPSIPRSLRYVRGYMPLFAVVLKPVDATQVQVTIALSISMRGNVSADASSKLQVRTIQNLMSSLRKAVPLWEARLRKRPASPKKTRYYTPFLAKALVAVVSEDQNHLSLLEGDVMYILKLQDDGTCVAYLNGQQGLVRSEFLQFHADAEYPHTSESYAPFEQLLVENHWAVVRAVSESADATMKDQVAGALMKIFHRRDRLHDLVKTLISVHIATTVNAGTLFRGSDTVSSLLAKMARAMGHDYLVSCIGPLVEMIIRHSFNRRLDITAESLEVDPQQLKLVTQLVDAFLAKLYTSLPRLPTCIRVYADQLKREVAPRFPGMHLQIVGGFIILRFISPAVVSPDVFGIYKGELTAEARRALVQVSKIIQNISNGHEFNEPHMKPLNEFTHAKRDEFHAWLEAAASVPEPALPDKPMEKCTEVEVEQALAVLHTSLSQRLSLVKAELHPWGGALPEGDMMEKLLAVLLDLGPPGPRHKRLTEAEAITAQVMRKLESFNTLRADAQTQLMGLIHSHVKDQAALHAIVDLLQQLETFDVQRGMFRNLLHSVERETRLKDAVTDKYP